MNPPHILLSAGDLSGEIHAARLAEALRRRTGARIFGMGGERMRAAGVELVADYRDVHVVGITETWRRLPDVWRTWRRLETEAARRKPQLAVMVDSPGFHFRLARRLKRQGVRNIYFIGPQVWAWRPGRVKWIRQRFERVLCIFPFEEEFYRQHGVAAEFVGHPLVDAVRATMSRAAFRAAHGFSADAPLVALLPGSRPGEVRNHLPVMLAAAQRLHREHGCEFVVPAAAGLPEALFAPALAAGVPVRVVRDAAYDALAAADCAVVTSGTATVEAALLGAPMVVVYRLSPLTAFFVRRMVRAPHFAMVNLVAGKRVVAELFQQEFTAERVAAEAGRLLASAEAREAMRRELAQVRARLGPGGAIERAAEVIAGLVAG